MIYRYISNHHILRFNYLTILYQSYLSKVKQKWISYQHLRTILGFPGGSDCKESACNAGDPGSIPGSARSLEKGMATYSSILAWRTLWTEETGGLQPTGLQRVRHDWATTTKKITISPCQMIFDIIDILGGGSFI